MLLGPALYRMPAGFNRGVGAGGAFKTAFPSVGNRRVGRVRRPMTTCSGKASAFRSAPADAVPAGPAPVRPADAELDLPLPGDSGRPTPRRQGDAPGQCIDHRPSRHRKTSTAGKE